MEQQKRRCVIKMHEDGVFTEADIPELVEELYDVCHKWKIIGIKLGLPLPKLDTMNQKYHFSDCTEIFCHVLQEWMKSCVNHAPPTWAVLLDVLKSRIVGECSLAEKIRASLNHQCSKDDAAESENVEKDSESVHEVSTSSNFELCGWKLKDGIGTKTYVDSTSKISSRVHIDTTIIHDDTQVAGRSPGFGCSCQKCTFASFITNGCPVPMSTESDFPYLNTSNLTSSERQALEGRLINEFQSINCKFSSMKSSLCQSLIDQKVSIKRLARVLADLGAFHSSKPYKPLLQDRLDDIINAEDIDTVFFIICDYSSFINFSLIEHVAAELGTEKDKIRVQEYQSELENYCRRNIFECPSYHTPDSNQIELVVKVDSSIEAFSLKHQLSFQSRLADVIKVAKYTLQLCSVEKGCIELTYQIPRFVKEAIFPLKEQQCGQLQKMRVISLSCGCYRDHDELIFSTNAGDIEKPETNQQEAVNNTFLTEGAGDIRIGIHSSSSQPNDDSRLHFHKQQMHMRPTPSIRKHKGAHRLVKQQEHITSEILDTQNLPDDVIEAVLHCLTHKFDCPIPQCSCRRVKLKINEIKVIQIVESGSGIDHGENKIMTTVEQFEAKSDVLPSICVDDIPLSDNIDKSYEADDNDVKRVRHHQHLGMLPVYDSGLSFDSVGSNDAEDF